MRSFLLSARLSALSLSALSLPALAEAPKVVTDIPPVHSLVAQVMGDLGAPVLLLDRGADAHHFQLRPSQARDIGAADAVIWIGPEMTPWLASALPGIGFRGVSLPLLDTAGTTLRSYGEEEGHHDHGAEDTEHAGHDHAEEDHAEDGHHQEGTDPHAWLDPSNAGVWLSLIAGELGRLDPANAAAYQANAAAARAEIAELDRSIAALLTPARGRPLVMFHDAYGYFADHYGLTLAESVLAGDAAAPGAERLAGLRAALKSQGVACIFPEAQHDPKYLATVAEGTGVAIGQPLDPEGSTLEPGPGLYAALLSGLAGGIADCVK